MNEILNMDFVQRTSLNNAIEAEVQYTEMLIKEEVKAFDLQEPAINGEKRAEPVCVTVKHELDDLTYNIKEERVDDELVCESSWNANSAEEFAQQSFECSIVKTEIQVKEQPVETEGNESKCDWKQAHYEIKDEREDVTEQHSMLKPEIVMANESDDKTVEDEAEDGVLEPRQEGNGINSDDKNKSEASKVWCDGCNKSFANKRYLNRHRCRPEEQFSCDICCKTFVYRSNLHRHKRTHTGKRPFTCSVCNKSFIQNTHLIAHVRTHTGERPFVCDVCGKSFSQKINLVAHKLTHSKYTPFFCEICDKSFSRSSNLAIHIQIHAKDRSSYLFECDLCNKRFSQNSTLILHKRIHSGERPYSCDTCNKAFYDKSHLIRHMIMHSDEKPYACELCNKLFRRRRSMIRHKQAHTDKKLYSCDVCNKKFRYSGSLPRHMLKHKSILSDGKPF